jgi:hypothetical protein
MRRAKAWVLAAAVVSVAAACGDGTVDTSRTPTEVVTTTEVETTITVARPASTTPPTTTASTTAATTTVSDVRTPLLVVTAPVPGAVVSSEWLRFTGLTEPDAALVAAGRYPVPVAADGSWSIVLRLRPGSNGAVFVATDPAGHQTEVRLTAVYTPPLVLAADGLGAATFGDPADTVVPMLVAVLGPPSSDITEPPPYTGQEVRWESPSAAAFIVVFEQSGSQYGFAGWELNGSNGLTGFDLATAEGITLGSTAADLLSAYPDTVFGGRVEPGCGDDWWTPSVFHVGRTDATGGGFASGLRGELQPAADPWARLDRALVDHGFPAVGDSCTDVMCANLFDAVQRSVGLPPTGWGLDRDTWLALGLPLPDDPTAPIALLRAGALCTTC